MDFLFPVRGCWRIHACLQFCIPRVHPLLILLLFFPFFATCLCELLFSLLSEPRCLISLYCGPCPPLPPSQFFSTDCLSHRLCSFFFCPTIIVSTDSLTHLWCGPIRPFPQSLQIVVDVLYSSSCLWNLLHSHVSRIIILYQWMHQ